MRQREQGKPEADMSDVHLPLPDDARRATRSPLSSAEIFRREMRHSRRIRILKIALPSLAVLMVAIFAAYSWIVPEGAFFGIDGAALRDGKLVMSKPRLDGVTGNDKPYRMTATRAVQDISNTDIVELEEIRADLPVNDKNRAIVEAASGIFDRANNTLDITSAMRIVSDNGMTALFQSADIDIDSGDLTTDKPVKVDLEGMSVTADSMSVTERGKVIVFDRRVRMRIDGSKVRTASPDIGASNETD